MDGSALALVEAAGDSAVADGDADAEALLGAEALAWVGAALTGVVEAVGDVLA